MVSESNRLLEPTWGPNGPRAPSKLDFLSILVDFGPILGRFWVDFEVIFATVGWSREYPEPKTSNLTPKTRHPKLGAQNPTPKLQKGPDQNLGSIPPVPKPQKSISKLWAAFPPALEECQGACRYLLLPEYHES